MALSKFQTYCQRAEKLLVRHDGENDLSSGRPEDMMIVARAQGAVLYDLDERPYTDYYLGAGAHILGHANHNVVLAAKKCAERGLGFGLMTQAEIDLAGYLSQHVPSLERMRFVYSGKEAVAEAAHLARVVTGRQGIVSFERNFEGSMVLPYNDTAAAETLIEGHAKDLAGIVVSLVRVTNGVFAADPDFLKRIFQISRAHGIIFICDETMTGFRNFPGCEHARMGICPDVTCLGTVIGGGFSLGVYGGSHEVMSCLSNHDGVWLNDPVIFRSGLMALRLMTENFYRALNRKAEAFMDQMNAFFKDKRIDIRMMRYGSMMQMCFGTDPFGTNDGERIIGRPAVYDRLRQHLLERGIFFPQRETEPFFLSGKHSKKDLTVLRDAMETFFGEENDAKKR